MTTKHDTPPLKDRNRIFPSSRSAAASLNLPEEVFKFARARGVECFHASNRVHERPFMEFVIQELNSKRAGIPASCYSDRDDDDLDYDYWMIDWEALYSASPQFEIDLSNLAFQLRRLVWGNAAAQKANEARRETFVNALPAFEEIESKCESPSTFHLERWQIEKDPFVSIGVNLVSFWQIGPEHIKKKESLINLLGDWEPVTKDNAYPPSLITPGAPAPWASGKFFEASKEAVSSLISTS